MPTVTLNKKTVMRLVGKEMPDEELKDRISMLGTDLESVEGDSIEVEIFPNRPDLLSEQGFARALSSFLGVKTGLSKFDIKKGKDDYRVIVDQSVESVRPFTACAIVKGLMFDDEKIREVIQIQEKLHVTYGRNRKKCAIGVYPLEKIKLPIYYIAKDPKEVRFRPLEMNEEMDGLQVLSRHPAGRDYAHLLDGKDKFPFFIDDAGNVLSMPPVINSHMTGRISETTTDVFVEFSGFDQSVVSKGLNMLVTALADMGGEIHSMVIEYKDQKIVSPDLSPSKMEFDKSFVSRWLGVDLDDAKIKECLEKMGYGYEDGNALVPAYRADVLHSVDLSEDIAIAYGYENFEPTIPNVATAGEEDHFEIFKSRIGDVLASLGLVETKTYNLINKQIQTTKMGIEQMDIIEIANPLNIEYDSLRCWMIPSLMKVLQDNLHHEYPQRVFTIGRIFKKGESETGAVEADRLSVVLCEPNADLTKARQVFDAIMNALSVGCEAENTDHLSFVPGRVARMSVNGKKVAYVGEIHPRVLENFDIEMPVAAIELNLTDLFSVFRI